MSSEQKFFRLKASGIARSREDEFTELCFEIGAAGVAEELPFTQPDLVYEAQIVEPEFVTANVFFTETPGEDALLKLQGSFPEAQLERFVEENRDWLEEWKKGFKPFLFSEPFWIVPSWCEPPAEARSKPETILFVEPGMAFGTGTHETTRLAADLVIGEFQRQRERTVLDVGTGTGILALVAHRMGSPHVVGIDNDPEARRTARENLEQNQASQIEIPDLDIEEITGQFDLVIANIIDGVLTILRHELNRTLKPGGKMILSGVLLEREKEFYEHFTQETGLELVRKVSEGEWSAALLVKSGESR
jgi:ribosomal protein L11 methyltransferase